MTSEQGHRGIRIALWSVVVLAMVGVAVGALVKHLVGAPAPGFALAAPGDQPGEAPAERELFAAPDLTLTDQNGKAFRTADLHGHPWIADFVFTTCAGQCPMMSHEMAGLQKQTPADVKLVSFTVDPVHDTPPVLKAYAAALKADDSRWHFLTGTQQQMAEAAVAMKISVDAASGDQPLVHSDRFLLVNPGGKVVGIYDGTNADDVKRLAVAAAKLAAGKSS